MLEDKIIIRSTDGETTISDFVLALTGCIILGFGRGGHCVIKG
jgi:hypothetical protein